MIVSMGCAPPLSAEPGSPAVFTSYDADGEVKGNPFRARLGKPLAGGGFRLDSYHLWDPSVIKVGDQYHLFASCWSGDFSNWKQSYIIRAVSDNLLGPYEFAGEVFRARGEGFFDAIGCHNPKITSHDGRYYLYYIGVPAYESGVAVSDSIEDPWVRQPGPEIPANNPALWVHEDGSVYGLRRVKVENPNFDPTREKSGTRNPDRLLHLQALRAESIFGPYTVLHGEGEHALPENFEVEDPCVWRRHGRYHVLLNDWGGHATGHWKAITYYTSENGLSYDLVSDEPVLIRSEPVRFADGSEQTFARIERPNIVLDEQGDVVAMLVACLPEDQSEGSRIVIFPVDHFDGTRESIDR